MPIRAASIASVPPSSMAPPMICWTASQAGRGLAAAGTRRGDERDGPGPGGGGAGSRGVATGAERGGDRGERRTAGSAGRIAATVAPNKRGVLSVVSLMGEEQDTRDRS